MNNGVRCTDAMFFYFYGTKSSDPIKIQQFKELLGSLRKIIRKQNQGLDQDIYIEVIYHLGFPPTKKELRKARKISGLNQTYFKKIRPIELALVASKEYKELFKILGIEHGFYSDLPPVVQA